jgi:hypothetical protein
MSLRRTLGTDHVSASPTSKTLPADQGRTAGLDGAERGNAQAPDVSWTRKLLPRLPIVAVAFFSFVLGLFAGISTSNIPVPPYPAPPAMNQCTTETVAALQPNRTPTADALRQAVEHCYSLIYSHDLLKDFATRELNFMQQYRANGVLMWMVVAVTLSGVLLAALQLMASYELAHANRKSPLGDSEFSLKRDRVVLKSSITGLFILVMSFAFFLVFVLYVYRFEQAEHRVIRLPPQAPILPMGGLGPPPAAK